MVRKFCITALALLSFAVSASASESGILSARAQRSFSNGKIAKGYGQLERALLASRKESDLRSEARVLLSMAQIRTMSLDFVLADSMISLIKPEILDKTTGLMFLQGKAALANAQGKSDEAVKFCGQADPDSVKKTEDALQAGFYSECAIAKAAAHRSSDAEEDLKMVGKRAGKKSGYYAWTAARIADLTGKGEADSLYQVAEQKSIQGNVPYMTATILYHRSQLKSTSAKDADELKLRCKNAFELMGLPNNSKRCAE